MRAIFALITRSPGSWIFGFLLLLIVIAALPTTLLNRVTLWNQSPDWARLIFQVGTLMLALVFGLIPILKWYEEAGNSIIERKPIIVTDRDGDNYRVRNLGDAPALTAWIIVEEKASPIPIGAFDAHESRTLPESVSQILRISARHITLGFSRFQERPYTVVFNVWNDEWRCYTHGFRRKVCKESPARGGTVKEYLAQERAVLLEDLRTFIS